MGAVLLQEKNEPIIITSPMFLKISTVLFRLKFINLFNIDGAPSLHFIFLLEI